MCFISSRLYKVHFTDKIKGSHLMMSYITKSKLKSAIFILFASFIFSGCAAVHSARLASQCNSDLAAANAELDKAKVDGFASTVAWTKAATLLAAAKIQQQFDKFPNCINKAARAHYYIKQSKIK